MNRQLQKLYQIAQKDSRRIIGLMSGTSLDGLDIALCRMTGSGPDTHIEVEKFCTQAYSADFRGKVREVFAQRHIDQQFFSGLHAYIGAYHAQLINKTLADWNIQPQEIDLIASHGQTVYHAPISLTQNPKLPNSTLQIGDADHIAVHTGIITLSDFRQKHIAAGGEGAPLAAYGDYLLFSDVLENRFLLNIGGISNYTFIPHQSSQLQAYATDIGPGNTMMNQYMKKHFHQEMDQDAELALQGKVHSALLEALLAEPFLKQGFPKTTGPELFNLTYLERIQAQTQTESLAKADVMATLCQFAAEAIVQAISQQAQGLPNCAVYISGGGLHNPLLVQHIKSGLPGFHIDSFACLGINPDAKEAVLFALLANEAIVGNPEHVQYIADSPAVCMGKISFAE